MSNRYDVERMLNRLVETDDEKEDNTEKAVYSWQKDKNYRDKRTEDLSVDELINSIGTGRGKHESARRRSSTVKRQGNENHSIKQEIVYRSPEEIQEEVNKQEDVDSRKYLNNMLDRMEKEIASMDNNPLKPKPVRVNAKNSNSESGHREKNVIKVKARKKEEVVDSTPVESIEPEPQPIETAEEIPVVEDIKDVKDTVEEKIQETVQIAEPEIIELPEPIEVEEKATHTVTEESNPYSDKIEDYDSLDEEIQRNEQEISELLAEDEIEVPEIPEQTKKGFFSRLFSKKNKKEVKTDSEDEADKDGIYGFDEEEFNRKFDELSEQISELEDNTVADTNISEEDEYFFGDTDIDASELNNFDLGDTIEEIEEISNYDSEKTEDNQSDLSISEEENEFEESEDEIVANDITEDTTETSDDEDIFIEKIKPEEKEIVTESKLKQKRYVVFGVIITLFAIIGIVTVLYIVSSAITNGVRGTSVKSKIEQKVYPLVAYDITEFNISESYDDSQVIGASILNILMNDDVSSYTESNGMYTIPATDVEMSAVELFGSDIKIEKHQNATLNNVVLYYDETSNVYSVPVKPLAYTAKPYVSTVSSDGESYKAQVLYITDYPDWIEDKSGEQSYYNIVCDYVLKQDSNGEYYIESITIENN